MLDIAIRRAAENLKNSSEIKMPKRIIPLIMNKEPSQLKKAIGVEYDNFSDHLEEIRAMNNRLENKKT